VFWGGVVGGGGVGFMWGVCEEFGFLVGGGGGVSR